MDPIKTEKDVFGLMMNGKKEPEEELLVYSPTGKSWQSDKFYSEAMITDKEGHRRGVDLYNYPLIMIPIHGTKRSENELFIKMLDEAREEVNRSSTVIAIGYNFGDELFIKELNKLDLTKKELILVGTKKLTTDLQNHLCYKNAAKFWKGNIRIFNGDGFTAFVDAIF
jgi:hypothetical protein